VGTISADPGLRRLLGLPAAARSSRADRDGALAVLSAGHRGLFEEIFDIVALGFRPSRPGNYRTVLERLGVTRPDDPLDDLAHAGPEARDIGMRTVLSSGHRPSPSAVSPSGRSDRRSSRRQLA
jgi:hypothetical protein